MVRTQPGSARAAMRLGAWIPFRNQWTRNRSNPCRGTRIEDVFGGAHHVKITALSTAGSIPVILFA